MWGSTYYEFSCAYIGHCKATGLGRWAPNSMGWTRASIEDFQAEVEAMKVQKAEWLTQPPRYEPVKGD